MGIPVSVTNSSDTSATSLSPSCRPQLSVEETRGFFDWYLVDAFGYHGAVLVQWIKHSSKHSWHPGTWRTTMQDIAAFLGLKERATYDVVKKLRHSGIIKVEERKEKRSPNGHALHFSVNEEREEEIRLQSEEERIKMKRFEILRRKGTTSKPQKGPAGSRLQPSEATVGRKLRAIKGTAGRIAPTVGGDCQQETADLTETHTSRDTFLPETHTRAEFRAGERTPVATLPHVFVDSLVPLARASVCCEEGKKNSERTPRKTSPRQPAAPPPSTDASQSSASPSINSLSAIELAWFEAVGAAYGEESYIPPKPTRWETNKLIVFCNGSKISPIDYVRWFVADWESMRIDQKNKWMQLVEFPIFSSVVNLAPKVLPSFLTALDDRHRWEEKVLPKEERKRREEEALRKREEQKRRLDEEKREQEAERRGLLEAQERKEAARREEAAQRLYLYKQMEVIPDDHPLRDEIIRKHKKTGEPIVASQYECVPLSKIPEDLHGELQRNWEARLESYLWKKYPNMTYTSAKDVPRDHPARKELIETFGRVEKGRPLAALEGIGVIEVEAGDQH